MKKALIIGALLVAVIAIPLIAKKASGPAAKAVTLEAADQRTIKASILASGRLVHEDEVKLSSEVIGKVRTLLVEEGEAVTAGQLVLQIDEENFRAALAQNEAAVRLEEIAIERQKLMVDNLVKQFARKTKLHDRGLIGEDAFDNAENELAIARVDLRARHESLVQSRARLDQARDQLAKTQIRSPIDGIVTSLDIKVGETAIASTTNIAGSSLMTIANPGSMLTEVYVDEADIANVSLGQSAEVSAIAFPDTPLAGTVVAIASTAKQVTGRQGLSFEVQLALDPEAQLELRPGMSCRSEIFTSSESEVIAVPVQAVLYDSDTTDEDEANYVFVEDEGLARKQTVILGLADDNYQEIRQGLDIGQAVVTGPYKILRGLRDGNHISAIKNPDPAAE